MLDFQQLVICALIPGLCVCGSIFIARRREFSCRVEIAAAIAIAVSLFAFRWLDEWNSLSGDAKTLSQSLSLAARRFWLPKEARDWLAMAFVVAAPLIALDHAMKRPRWMAIVWGSLISVTMWRFLLGSVYLDQWTLAQLTARLIGVGMLVTAASLLLGIGKPESQPRGFLKRIVVAMVFVLASIVGMSSGSISGGMIGLLVAAAAGHAAIVGLVIGQGRTSPISAGFWIFALTAVLLVGVYFSEITTTNFLLLIAATGIAGFIELRPPATRFSRLAVTLAVIASLGLAGTAAGLSITKALDEMQKKSANPYSSMY
jgi:hypothetical protein